MQGLEPNLGLQDDSCIIVAAFPSLKVGLVVCNFPILWLLP